LAVRPIVLFPDPILKQKCKKVHRVDASIRQLIEDLFDTVHDAPGSGLSAPQIGVPLRVIVNVAGEKEWAVINPEIVAESDEEIEDAEGCLSIPGWWGDVKRKSRVTVRGVGKRGKPIKIKSEGYEARCFQHEIDHLNGILFIDRMEDRRKLYKVESKEEEEEMEEEHVYA
jgi:peptide deformylase